MWNDIENDEDNGIEGEGMIDKANPPIVHIHQLLRRNFELKGWLTQNPVIVYLVTAILCLVLFSSALLFAVDFFSQYRMEKNRSAIEYESARLESMIRQVDDLQQRVKEKNAALTRLHQQVLSREGRLKEAHIVNGQVSRLVANAAKRESVAVSRSFPRYSPYQFDVTMPSAVTAFELEQVLADTPLSGLGRSFIKAELAYGINAMFLAALAVHESHWGKSDLAQDKNNLYGFGAYDASPYSSALTFATKHDCIMQVARFIREHYIEGQFGNGRNIADINRSYASDREWSQKVFMLMSQIDQSIQANDA